MIEQAQTFIWNNGRLLERHLFAYLFQNGDRQPILQGLQAYQNADGGFGNGLEPDKRTPTSQPIDQEFALRVLDDIGWDDELVGNICDWLVTITTDAGGIPFVLPTVSDAPRAPWWNSDPDPPASINPTASIAGLLHKHNVQHPWLPIATDFCWQQIDALESAHDHDLLCVALFLQHVPDRERATHAFSRIGPQIYLQTALNPAETGYVKKPLDWAPTPDSICFGLYDSTIYHDHLALLASQQQEDGGWLISWPPISPGSELEYRGVVTLNSLKTLQAYGYLPE